MGLLDYFKRRHERESAVPEAAIAELGREPEPAEPIGQHIEPQAGASGPTAATDLGGLVAMVSEAFRTGDIQVAQGESRTIDLTGSGVGDEIRAALARHGIDTGATGAHVDAADVPGLQEEILRALRDSGVDLERTDESSGA